MPAYVDSLCEEIRIANKDSRDLHLHTIYFGGGTPSLILLDAYEKILSSLHDAYFITEDCEISLEANPGTISKEYLAGLFSLGFNRLSLGVQSTDTFDLARLDRIHSIEDVLSGIYHARQAGFSNLNLDLIFGQPWQTLESWENSLRRAINLDPEHFSLYSLIIEPGTALDAWYQKGLIAMQDQDLEADMYESAMDLLAKAGYEQYEISNWAKNSAVKDFRCRHNLQYWTNRPYFGFGAGAHGYVEGMRTVNPPQIEDYIYRVMNFPLQHERKRLFPAAISISEVDQNTQMRDFMMLGLRLVQEGVSVEVFAEEFGQDMTAVFEKEIDLLVKQGLIEWVQGGFNRLRLTKRGIFVANQVFMHFV